MILHAVLGIKSFPRSVYVLEPLLTIGFLAGVRLLSRVIFESVWADARSARRVAIIGAGVAAQMIIRELRQPGASCVAVACVDDDRSKRGIKVQGVPVMGSTDELPAILKKHPVDEILIAVPSATASQMQRFVAICERSGTRFRTAPALRELIAGEITVKQLREVNLEDLLGRQPVHIDLASVGPEIQNRTLLVTGAAGSIGSELCRQLLQFRPAKLICVDQSETGVFHLQRELANCEARVSVVHYVADVADYETMLNICGQHRPHVIFHAAAYKHVPMMEANPREAVKNNVFGLIGLLEAGEANACQAFVLISSDKAVNPTSVMGATKRLGELIVSCRPATTMRRISVRFGNVLGSNGSVIPLLQEQIRDGRDLTITHPSVRRFFMTVHEAVSLVLQAFTVGNHGEVLVLDMGRSVRIVDLAKTLIRLSGKSLEEVKIRFTGLRPGEKVYEELFYPEEKIASTRYTKIRSARSEILDWPTLESQLLDLQVLCAAGNDIAVRTQLMSVVSVGFGPRNNLPRRTARIETSAPRVLRRAAGQD